MYIICLYIYIVLEAEFLTKRRRGREREGGREGEGEGGLRSYQVESRHQKLQLSNCIKLNL